MSASGQAHTITIVKYPNRIRVLFHGTVIADTTQALVLKEGRLPPIHYIPRQDVHMFYLQRTDHGTHCPFKGDASYFSVCVGETTVDNAVWTYETPLDAVAAIKGYVSFDKDRMDAIDAK